MTPKQNPCQMELLSILNFLMFSLSQYVCFFHGSRKDGFDPSALFEAAGQLKLQFLAEKYAGCWAVGLPGCFGLQTQRLWMQWNICSGTTAEKAKVCHGVLLACALDSPSLGKDSFGILVAFRRHVVYFFLVLLLHNPEIPDEFYVFILCAMFCHIVVFNIFMRGAAMLTILFILVEDSWRFIYIRLKFCSIS